jgi:hypothetical protein
MMYKRVVGNVYIYYINGGVARSLCVLGVGFWILRLALVKQYTQGLNMSQVLYTSNLVST